MSRTIAEIIAATDITVRVEFVPFSQSRNKDNVDNRGNIIHTLNWKVALHKASDTPLLVTDYSAGIGHCPSYGTQPPANWNQNVRNWVALACAYECEKGKKARWTPSLGFGAASPVMLAPKDTDVLFSLVSESDVLNYLSFEGWAQTVGYDPDSRKAESIYKESLRIGLAMTNGLGADLLADLQEAFQDY